MKKFLIIGLCTLSLFATGCVSKLQREEALAKAGEEYYEKYMSGLVGLDEPIITIEMLEKSNDENDTNFDLSLLKKCDKDSKVTFTLINGKIEDKEIELNCK